MLALQRPNILKGMAMGQNNKTLRIDRLPVRTRRMLVVYAKTNNMTLQRAAEIHLTAALETVYHFDKNESKKIN